ncbi:TniB family NTP-binding protein [Peribacillus sp. SCS-155]|uniref:TniB family NTP-binding protein n=1 Tax=Peribacillus sedimenti TaxID=3115297 RepID=UPI0039069118
MGDPNATFANRISNLYVEHPKVLDIYNHLDTILAHRELEAKSRHTIIYGTGGVGKTKMAENYVSKHPPYTIIDEEGTHIDIVPVICIEIPDPFTYTELYFAILKGLGAPRIKGTVGELKDRTRSLLEKQQVKMIIMDEIHNIIGCNMGTKNAMKSLKHISNESNVSLVLLGTPEAKELMLDDQYKTRFRPKVLYRFEECNEEFCHFLELLEKQLNPPFPIGLGDNNTLLPKILHHQCKGKVGFLVPIIIEAYRMLGVLEPEFNEFENAKLSVDILVQAHRAIIGDEDFSD